jgi:uncharacterized protein DUF2806
MKQEPGTQAGPKCTEEDRKPMSNEISIINLGELLKPAEALIEKVSDAVGGLFKPYQIVRVAKAEAEAEQIHAQSRIQISDLEQRAFHRFLEEEAKKQRNIEDITRAALPQLNGESQPQKVENDWIANFFGKVVFTEIGQQLAPICGSQPDPDFYEYTLTKWKALGYIKERNTEQVATMPKGES